ncbi:MAG: hypothetical protein KDB27_28380, partial [Planctomycetales bacterium]|nr:hypothetical protein [Planctomycetales bacterium]
MSPETDEFEAFLRSFAPQDRDTCHRKYIEKDLEFIEANPDAFAEEMLAISRQLEAEQDLHPLAAARSRAGLDQAGLAEQASKHEPSITAGLIAAIEEFKDRILPHVAFACAEVLNVNISDLLVPNVHIAPTGMLRGAIESDSDGAKATTEHIKPSDGTFLELQDFLGADVATTFACKWSESPELEFRAWLQENALSQTSEYEKHLMLAVGYTCLLQDHQSAELHAKRCKELAEGEQRIDANYLFARNRWYLNRSEDQPEAFAALREALSLALANVNFVRAAHCCIYMARLGGKFSDLLNGGQTVDGLYRDATDYALRADRSDIELLSIHARCVWLRSQKRNDQVREIAPKALNNPRYQSFDRLLNSLRAALGMALRQIGTADARMEARETYDQAIASAGNDGMAAMCHYLKADIVADEMFSLKQEAMAEPSAGERNRLLRVADDRRKEAIDLCQHAASRLRQVGDLSALHKANLRLAFLENTDIGRDSVKTDGELVDDYAVAFHRLKGLLLNTEYNETPKKKTLAELQEIVELYFGNIVINDMQRRGERIDVSNILSESGLLCVSIPLANDLVQVLFSRDGDSVTTEGWFSIKDYSNCIRPSLEKWLKMDEVSFRSNAGDFWASIVEKFRTVVPIKPELTDKRFEDVVILSPVT